MADPRAQNSFELGPKPHETATFAHDSTIVFDPTQEGGSAQVGLAVSIESNNVVTLAGDGENVLGKLLSVDSDGFCTVQHSGWMTLPGGDGAGLTAGSKIVGDLGPMSAEGYIRVVNSAQASELAVARGMIVDASTATDVVVKL
jgi:hypothetical protein